MRKLFTSIQRWWYFHIANSVVRKGEHGGFKWVFRRFTLEISTVSGNFSAKFTANEHPYAYLLASKTDENIVGYCEHLYYMAMTLTTDQKFVDDVSKAINSYAKRLEEKPIDEFDDNEEQAIAEVKAVQEYVDAPKSEKRKMERDSKGRFKKVVKEADLA